MYIIYIFIQPWHSDEGDGCSPNSLQYLSHEKCNEGRLRELFCCMKIMPLIIWLIEVLKSGECIKCA